MLFASHSAWHFFRLRCPFIEAFDKDLLLLQVSWQSRFSSQSRSLNSYLSDMGVHYWWGSPFRALSTQCNPCPKEVLYWWILLRIIGLISFVLLHKFCQNYPCQLLPRSQSHVGAQYVSQTFNWCNWLLQIRFLPHQISPSCYYTSSYCWGF